MESINIFLENSTDDVFYTGQDIVGRVEVFFSGEGSNGRDVKVHLLGQSSVRWQETVTTTEEKEVFGEKRTETKTETFVFSSQETYVDVTETIFPARDAQTTLLPPGRHSFDFRLHLPERCPSSFHGSVGSVKYVIEAHLGLGNSHTREISVISGGILDMNKIPAAKAPMTREETKNLYTLCFRRGQIHAEVKLPKSGYVPGEKVTFGVRVTNSSKVTVTELKAKLQQATQYKGYCAGRGTKHKLFWRTLGKTDEQLALTNGQKTSWMDTVVMPAVPPWANELCGNIIINYYLRVTVVPKGMHLNMVFLIPLMVGSVPIVESIEDTPTAESADQKPETAAEPSSPPPFADIYPNLPPPSYADATNAVEEEEEDSKGKVRAAKRAEGSDDAGFSPKYPMWTFN